MSAINACIKCISEYEKELGVPKTPLAKAARIELAALEAVAEAAREFSPRAYHAPMCPKREDYTKTCDCGYDEFCAALDKVKK